MKRTIARLYITTISILIVLGLIYLLNQVRVSRNEYIQNSILVADETQEIIENNWFKYKNFENQALIDDLRQQMNNQINIHSIIIYSKEKGLTRVISLYNESDFLLNSIVPDDPMWSLRPEYSFTWWQRYNNNIISTPLKINESGYYFDLIYNVLSTEKVEKAFGDAFVIVAIFLVLTIFVIVIFTVWKNKYSIKEYDDDFESAGGMIADDFDESIGDQKGLEASESFGDETSDDLDFDGFDSDSSDDLDDFGLDSDSSDDFDELDDFDIAANNSSMSSGSSDDFDFGSDDSDLDTDDDFDLDTGDDASDSMDDFDLDFGDESSESVDDFDLDTGDDASDSMDDFDLDFGDESSESVDDFDLDTGDDTSDSMDDFDLDFGDESSESTDDFDLDTGDDISDSMDDFDLDFGDESADSLDDTSDTMDDFDLDIGDDGDDFDLDLDSDLDDNTTEELDLSSELGEEDDLSLDSDDLDDFNLDIDSSEETFDEMEDFDLDLDSDSSSEDIDSSSEDFDLDMGSDTDNTTDDMMDDFDLDMEPESASSDELDDFDLGIEPESGAGDELDDFDFEVDSESTQEMDDFDAEFGEDMDLSPEVIEESSNINDLPEMDIEDELLNEDLLDNRVIRDKAEIGPDLSSQLEKAAVEEKELSVAVIQITGDDITSHLDYITENFGETASIYQLESRKIVVSMNRTSSAQAVKSIGAFLESAQSENLEMSAGISSTSSRRVGENRLLGEAIKAGERAQEITKPLIAFRPDPEKYKDFIKNS